jgi:hypothetical protein
MMSSASPIILLHLWNFLEYRLVAADLIRIVQGSAHDPFAERLEHHHLLASRHYDARYPNHFLLFHGVADDSERLLTDPVLRREVVRSIAKAIVDGRLRDKLLDVDGVRALDGDVAQFVIPTALRNDIAQTANRARRMFMGCREIASPPN